MANTARERHAQAARPSALRWGVRQGCQGARMRVVPIVAMGLLSTSPLADASDLCPILPLQPQYSTDIPPKKGCSCGSSLKNVVATLNTNFKIGAVCDLRWRGTKSDQPIDLRVNSISLDSYTDGDLPFGQILLMGHTTLKGSLRYAPGNAGDIWFEPQGHPIAALGTAFSKEVEQLKLARPYTPAEFQVPRALQNACWSATATISVTNVWVTLGGNDEAGAYPARYRVMSVINLKAEPCG